MHPTLRLVDSPPPSGVPFGRYLLQERVATGGMAEVFRALYRPAPGVEKTVALKRVLPHLGRDEEFLTLFRQEAALGARLSHANVVQLLDVGEVSGEIFLALEFVNGRNLRQILRRCADRRTVVPIALALYMVSEAAKGLGYAHTLRDAKGTSLGIVHRDVSPANLLVSFEGEVKVADFGIARAVAYASTTNIGVVRGKASYMSPEQARGLALDGRSDLFALGAVLWELVTGRRLFIGDTETEISTKLVDGVIARPSQHAPGVPEQVDEVVMKALDRDPDARFPDAVAFSRALATVLARLGPPIAGADIAMWMRGLFREEIEHAEQAAAAAAGEDPPSSTNRSVVASAPVPSPYAEDVDNDVQPLPLEERRKLFDLPPARATSPVQAPTFGAAVVPLRKAVSVSVDDEPLELERDAGLAKVDKAVTRIHLDGRTAPLAGAMRLGVVGLVSFVLLFGFMIFVYR